MLIKITLYVFIFDKQFDFNFKIINHIFRYEDLNRQNKIHKILTRQNWILKCSKMSAMAHYIESLQIQVSSFQISIWYVGHLIFEVLYAYWYFRSRFIVGNLVFRPLWHGSVNITSVKSHRRSNCVWHPIKWYYCKQFVSVKSVQITVLISKDFIYWKASTWIFL